MIQGMGGLWGSLGVHCPVGELWLRAGSGFGRIHGVYQPRRLFFLNVCIHIMSCIYLGINTFVPTLT